MLTSHETEIRVRYQETDGQGHVHHANYITYFELGRTELMRASGHDYEQFEASGVDLVVVEMACKYLRPCQFGDVIRVRTRTVGAKGARLRHEYEVLRGDELLAEGQSTVACVDRSGKVRRLPNWMLGK